MSTTLEHPKKALNILPERNSQRLKLSRISQSEFTQMEDEWDCFHEQTQIPSPFQSWQYLDCWWQVYGKGKYDVRMYVARDQKGRLVGAAPLILTRKGAFSGARGKFRHLAFMGGVGELLGESLEIPALPGYEDEFGTAVANLIVQDFQGKWDVAYFYLAPEKSVSMRSMLTRLDELGVTLQTSSSLDSPYLSVDGTWDEHMASRPTKFASRVRYILSYAERRYNMQIEPIDHSDKVVALIDELTRLTSKRWSDDAQAFHTPEFVQFHQKFAQRIYSKNRLSGALLKLNGDVAGAAYNFIYANKMWGYQVPWDLCFKSARPGNVLHIWSAKTTFDLGLSELDTLPGKAGYKDEWTTKNHTLNTYEAACPRSLGGTIYRLARGLDRILQHKPQTITS